MARGVFIVVEGLDKTGKSTQVKRLHTLLLDHGYPAEYVRFPDRTTPMGHLISTYLTLETPLEDHAIHLLFSANRWERMDAIKDMLMQGKTVIADRYAYSGAAFSMAKGLDMSWCQSCDQGLIVPDLVLFLQASEDVLVKRGGYGEERYEHVEFQRQVQSAYTQLRNRDVQTFWKVIDASQDIQSVEEDIWQAVQGILKQERDELRLDLWMLPDSC